MDLAIGVLTEEGVFLSKVFMGSIFKEIQENVLNVFREEIPSLYFSDKSDSDYHEFCKTFEYFYHDLLNFPPRMFENRTLLDFGGGTGESTIYFTNWGSKNTVVELNEKAISLTVLSANVTFSQNPTKF